MEISFRYNDDGILICPICYCKCEDNTFEPFCSEDCFDEYEERYLEELDKELDGDDFEYV